MSVGLGVFVCVCVLVATQCFCVLLIQVDPSHCVCGNAHVRGLGTVFKLFVI